MGLRPCTSASHLACTTRSRRLLVAYAHQTASPQSLRDMHSLVRANSTVSPLLRCGRLTSAYAINSLRPHQPRIGRCNTISTHSNSTLVPSARNLPSHKHTKHMGGGPKFPLSTASMHRAPAAMVTKPVDVEIRTPRDPNTLSNYLTRHTSVDFEIEFEKKRLVGKVVLRLESLTNEEVDVTLDSRYADPFTMVYDRANMPVASSTSQRSKLIVRVRSSALETGLSHMVAL
jgi:hypothetical protein